MPPAPVLVKKYGNRRLYDTSESRYVTLDELAEKIRGGADVRVVDAKTAEDLTQSTLTQIILESRKAARLLPVPLLVQMVRMGDDALAEFFSHYITFALDAYLQLKRGAQAVSPYNPFANVPFQAGNAFARMFLGGGGMPWEGNVAPQQPVNAAPTPPPAAPVARDEVAEMRRELEELKREMRKKRR